MINEWFDLLSKLTKEWSQLDGSFFEIKHPGTDECGVTKKLIATLHYHNFQIWNYEDACDAACRASDGEGVIECKFNLYSHNKKRGNTVYELDLLFMEKQQNAGEFHSETLGSLLDRISIIKIRQMVQKSRDLILAEAYLTYCACNLWDDMIHGRKRIVTFRSEKTYGK